MGKRGMKKIPLTKGKFTIVDNDDFEWLSKYKWHCRVSKPTKRVKKVYYASECWVKENDKYVRKLMHRMIMSVPKNLVVDHINGNTLDNRKCNLRVCTIAENSANRHTVRGVSKYKGVCRCKFTGRWKVRVGPVWVERFDSELDAAKAYDATAKEVYGEFARPNF